MARFNRNGKKNGRRKDKTITQRKLNSLRSLVDFETLVECCVGPGDKTIALKKWEARHYHPECEHWDLKMAKQPQHIQSAMKTISKVRTSDEAEDSKRLKKFLGKSQGISHEMLKEMGISHEMLNDRITVLTDSELEELKELSKKGPNARRNSRLKGRRQEQGRTRNRNHIDPPNDSKGWAESKKNERQNNAR